MLQYQGVPIMEYWRLRKIAKQVRSGILPKGADKETIFKALRLTRPKNAMEVFGFLSAKVERADGSLSRDLGLVSCKKVTLAFAKRLVDAMVTSGDVIDNFQYHKQGAGSAAESSGDTALGTQQVGATSGVREVGSTASNIYQVVGTITAGSAYGIREHGIFNASTGGILLDRSVVTNITVNTDDVVTWTYQLTVNTET